VILDTENWQWFERGQDHNFGLFSHLFHVRLWVSFNYVFCDSAGTDGQVDMKRIYGTTVAEGRVKPGKGVKV